METKWFTLRTVEDKESIAQAADILRRGGLLAIPTETVYGLGADGLDETAVLHIFEAKGRPQDNPLIVHVTGPEMLPGLVSEVPERAQLLMAAFCPGPLTIIMPRRSAHRRQCRRPSRWAGLQAVPAAAAARLRRLLLHRQGDRCTDHRIGLTVHNLDKIMDGNLDEVIDALATREQTEKLQKLNEQH